jgi:hypothetical protein
VHEHAPFLLVALLILVYGLFSRLAERLALTAPMFFTLVVRHRAHGAPEHPDAWDQRRAVGESIRSPRRCR